MLEAPEFDLVVAVGGSSARFQPQLVVQPMIDSAGAGKPLAAFLAPEAPDALARLAAAGVPSFRTPEACADAIAATLRRRVPRPMAARQPAAGKGRVLDEEASHTMLDRLGVPRAPSLALSIAADPPALPFAYPVAVKALSAQAAHKTELGGVVLGVNDSGALRAAMTSVRENAASHGVALDRVLVQPMISGVAEVLIGYRIDVDAGPLVVLAAGGVLTEIYRDRALRLAPIGHDAAREMIAEVKALKVLSGFRGKPAGDIDALVDAVVRFSQFATMPEVVEAEANPVMVRASGEGVIAVDALVAVREAP
jgi:acyl-CoA synthetase (NDP forming)